MLGYGGNNTEQWRAEQAKTITGFGVKVRKWRAERV